MRIVFGRKSVHGLCRALVALDMSCGRVANCSQAMTGHAAVTRKLQGYTQVVAIKLCVACRCACVARGGAVFAIVERVSLISSVVGGWHNAARSRVGLTAVVCDKYAAGLYSGGYQVVCGASLCLFGTLWCCICH